MEFIDIKKQYHLYKKEIDKAIHEVLESGHFIMGEQVQEIEQILANFIGVEHCISVSSGTDALLIALMALDIGPGDEVITTPFTWISSTEVIKLVGATPVFVDIDPETYNIDINQIEPAITSKTKALLPISLFGQMPDYTTINQIASKHNLTVIEDGAQSFGATQNGKYSCGATHVGATSFFPAKPFGCYGDGGAIFTNDTELTKKMRAIRNHGGEVRYEHSLLGLNGRFDTIQAAILLAKFPHFSNEIKKRQTIGNNYSELLKDICITPKISPGNTHTYAQYTIRLPNREVLIETFKKNQIPFGIYYPKCVHEQPVFAYLGHKLGSFPVSEKASNEVFSIPMHPWLTESDQDLIVNTIKLALHKQEMVTAQ